MHHWQHVAEMVCVSVLQLCFGPVCVPLNLLLPFLLGILVGG